MKSNIGSTIRSIREHKGKTLKSLAEDTGLSFSYLSLIERDKREPSVTNLSKIADAFGLPTSVLILVGVDDEMRAADKSGVAQQMMDIVEGLFKDDERYPDFSKH